MSNNLFKSGWIMVNEGEKRIIDNNALLEEKLSAVIRPSAPAVEDYMSEEDGFTDGLAAETVDALLESRENAMTGNLTAARDAILSEIEQAKEELAGLKEQADTMIADAKSQIGAMQMKAYEEAKNQGYQEGERLGRLEADAEKEEYISRKKQLEEEYEKKITELEPTFIEILTGIYEHIFKVDLIRYHDLVTNLLINVLQKATENRNFLIHVSKDDYESVLANRERIRAEAGGASVSMEIVEDMTLSRSQCFVETENGIYDCSLDTQLSELKRKLQLLSYEQY